MPTKHILPFLCLLLCTTLFAQPPLTLSKKEASLESVLQEITRQTGYTFFYNVDALIGAKPVSIHVKDAPLNMVLALSFKDQPVSYEIVNTTIVVKRKQVKAAVEVSSPKIEVKGKLVSNTGASLEGVSISVKGTAIGTVTNASGEFSLPPIDPDATLIISGVTVQNQEVKVSNRSEIVINVTGKLNEMDNVAVTVSTGYQTIPAERATGSFVHINNQLLNRSVSPNILERLNGVTPGLIFNKNTLPSNEKLGISIRGRSTIDEKVNADPLIIVDNFTYEGDINNINPNDIESITILKDAAAASIWGARAGNGVIVINTKKGAYGQKLKVELNANVTIGAKPDLWYTPNYLPTNEFIGIEQYLFSKGYFDADLNNTSFYPVISPVVEILALQRSGTISQADAESQLAALAGHDARDEINRHFYRRSMNSQNAVSFQGGSSNFAFKTAVGFDHNIANLVGNRYNRVTVNTTSSFKPFEKLEIQSGIFYTGSKNTMNGINFGGISHGTSRYGILLPYSRLAGSNGEPLPVVRDYRASYVDSIEDLGFLDGRYRPLAEIGLADNNATIRDIVLRISAKYRFTNHFNIEVNGQYQSQQSLTSLHRSLQTYSTRYSINRYSVRNQSGTFSYPFPVGGVLDLNQSQMAAYNSRAQANYSNIWGRHSIVSLAGLELREVKTEGYNRTAYGYNNELGTAVTNINYNTALPVNPAGSSVIPAPPASVSGTTNRFLSYFINAAYTYRDKYTFSASARKDGANIFGVKANDKITPLWSAGVAWLVHNESFYNLSWLPVLKIRGSYGYNGNVYNASAYLTAQYNTSSLTGAQYAFIATPPNPSLSWERVKNINLGIDLSVLNERINATIDFFRKDGLDLIQSAPLAPSVGFASFKGNAAATTTKGFDAGITTVNTKGKIKWTTTLIGSYITDKVKSFHSQYISKTLAGGAQIGTQEAAGIFAVPGKPLFGVYSYQWAGLDPLTGDPMGYVKGVPSKDYNTILNNTPPDSIIFHGASRPVIFGALRNTVNYKNWSLSFNILYKFKYFFRRSSVSLNSQNVLSTGLHTDFIARWQKPGDEKATNVPSVVYPANNNRNDFYQLSSALVEKADNIRLHDINLSYTINKGVNSRLPFSTLQLYVYASNVGLIWTANKKGIDPDYTTLRAAPIPPSISFGFRTSF